jgi:tRNA(Ile)-lysidine synthase
MLDRVEQAIRSHGMFAPGARVGVAVSGGADSRCLLDVLFALRCNWNLQLTVLHLNHCLRADESDADENFVRELAAGYGLPIEVERRDVKLLAAGDNLEQAAREARRAFFRRFLETGALDRVALGHTRSDQAETVLFRFLRGSHTTGLCGILPVTRDGLVRPLLYVDRSEVKDYLHSLNLTWREDSTNQEVRFSRNRIRSELLPRLTAEWNPQLPELLARYALLAQEDEEFWRSLIRQSVRFDPAAGGLVANIEFAKGPPALARRIIRAGIEQVRGDLRQIDFEHVDQVLNLLRSPDGHGRVQIPGVDVLRSFDWVRFAKPRCQPAERDYSFPVQPPCLLSTPWRTADFYFEVVDQSGNPRGKYAERGKLVARLKWGRAGPSGVELRNWRPGDAYRRAGEHREQKIKTMFHEARIPLWERRNWPIFTVDGRIAWAAEFGPAAEFVVDPAAATPVLLVIEREREKE